MEIHGNCHKQFQKVRDTFENNFYDEGEIGAALCIFHKGKKVVDLWAGFKNAEKGEPWLDDTIVPFFSVTKGLTALCFGMLADKKKLSYDKLVSHYWPDFANHGKENITVKQLLEHTAGLHSLGTKLQISDFWTNPEKVYKALIDQRPAWTPGEKQGYGAQIWGAYAAELFKRINGETAGTFFQREIAKKLKLNIYLGLPESSVSKVATIYPISNLKRILFLLPQIIKGEGSEGRAGRDVLFGDSEVSKAYLNPQVGLKGLNTFNDPELHKHELLWANGIGDARSLATIYNILAIGGKKGIYKLLSSSLLKKLSAKHPLYYDMVIHKKMGWNYGFLKEEEGIFSPNSETFGHPGMGGSLSFADTKDKIAFGYVCNKMDYRVRAPKTLKLCKAVYDSL